MYDQANELRELAKHAGCHGHLACAGRPRVIVVAGGKGRRGNNDHRSQPGPGNKPPEIAYALVDAARGGHAATLCRLEPRWTLADVLAGRRTMSEATQAGPEKLQVLPGAWEADGPADCSPASLNRLFAQLLAPDIGNDVLVLDAGNAPGRLAERCWQQSDAMLVITTPETAAVMETYNAIKLLWPPERTRPVHLLVNRAVDRHAADDVYCRMAKACRRFLAVELNLTGYVPADYAIDPDNFKKTRKGLNLAAVPADNRGALSVVDVLLNWSACVKFNGDRGTHSWHELTPAFSAP